LQLQEFDDLPDRVRHQADPNSVSQSTLKVWKKGGPLGWGRVWF
jgi:hypothetical protein